MGWEWRVFYRIEPCGPHTLPALAHRDLEAVIPEERTDVYLQYSEEAGMKERGGSGGGIEVKVRMETDANGWEKWKKKRFRGVADAAQYVQDLPNHAHSAQEAQAVSVHKRRLRACVDGSHLEQVELRVVVGDHRSLWCSVAVEGKRKEATCLVCRMLDICRSQAINRQVWICGYPAWVLWMAQEMAGQEKGSGRPEQSATQEEESGGVDASGPVWKTHTVTQEMGADTRQPVSASLQRFLAGETQTGGRDRACCVL